MTSPSKTEFIPIGHVSSPIKERGLREVGDVVSKVVVAKEFAEALHRIDQYSHIVVLFQFHQSGKPTDLKVHPRGDPARPKRGIFATCSPVRPNPIGLTTVRLLECRGNELTVRGLDAIDGTPVLDIKPYVSPRV